MGILNTISIDQSQIIISNFNFKRHVISEQTHVIHLVQKKSQKNRILQNYRYIITISEGSFDKKTCQKKGIYFKSNNKKLGFQNWINRN